MRLPTDEIHKSCLILNPSLSLQFMDTNDCQTLPPNSMERNKQMPYMSFIG